MNTRYVLRLITRLYRCTFKCIYELLNSGMGASTLKASRTSGLFGLVRGKLQYVLGGRVYFIGRGSRLKFVRVTYFQRRFMRLKGRPRRRNKMRRQTLRRFNDIRRVSGATTIFYHDGPILSVRYQFTRRGVHAVVLRARRDSLSDASTNKDGITMTNLRLDYIVASMLCRTTRVLRIWRRRTLIIYCARGSVRRTTLNVIRLRRATRRVESRFQGDNTRKGTTLTMGIPRTCQVANGFPFHFRPGLVSWTLTRTFAILAKRTRAKGITLSVDRGGECTRFARTFYRCLRHGNFTYANDANGRTIAVYRFKVRVSATLIILAGPSFVRFESVRLTFLLTTLEFDVGTYPARSRHGNTTRSSRPTIPLLRRTNPRNYHHIPTHGRTLHYRPLHQTNGCVLHCRYHQGWFQQTIFLTWL